MDEVQAGDVVKLKSDSLKMTVGSIINTPAGKQAFVIWEDAQYVQHTATYPVAALKKA